MEKVILVDENDTAIGAMDKMEAHRRGILHRAFSILIFNSKGEVLLQKDPKTNIIVAGFGQMHAAATLHRMNLSIRQREKG
jgi:isopentenyl-diphosphate delta-isomerase